MSAAAAATPTAAATAAAGSTEPALHVPTILSFVAILIAAMQGTLVLESAFPCRISVAKLVLLLALEALEVGIVLASELVTYIGLANALQKAITWLQWTPAWVLAVGLLQLLLDALFTLDLAVESRVNYVPISVRSNQSIAWEIVLFVFTLCLSLLLVGWRQTWWWDVFPTTASDVAAAAAVRNELSLSVGALVFAIGFAFVLLASLFVYLLVNEIAHLWSNKSLVRRSLHARASDRWHFAAGRTDAAARQPYSALVAQFRALADIAPSVQRDPATIAGMTDGEVRERLRREPLRIGNTVVGADVRHVLRWRTDYWAKAYRAFLVVENLVIIPLLVTVVVAVGRLYDKLDRDTFEALKELSEVVIVVAFLDLAITIKNLLWNYSENKQRDSDDMKSEPPMSAVMTESSAQP